MTDYSASLLKPLVNFNNFYIDSLGFTILSMLSYQSNLVGFFSLLSFYIFYLTFCTAMVRITTAILTVGADSHGFFPHLIGKAYNFSVLSKMLDKGILYMFLIRLAKLPSLHSLLRVYMINIC